MNSKTPPTCIPQFTVCCTAVCFITSCPSAHPSVLSYFQMRFKVSYVHKCPAWRLLSMSALPRQRLTIDAALTYHGEHHLSWVGHHPRGKILVAPVLDAFLHKSVIKRTYFRYLHLITDGSQWVVKQDTITGELSSRNSDFLFCFVLFRF